MQWQFKVAYKCQNICLLQTAFEQPLCVLVVLVVSHPIHSTFGALLIPRQTLVQFIIHSEEKGALP